MSECIEGIEDVFEGKGAPSSTAQHVVPVVVWVPHKSTVFEGICRSDLDSCLLIITNGGYAVHVAHLVRVH